MVSGDTVRHVYISGELLCYVKDSGYTVLGLVLTLRLDLWYL